MSDFISMVGASDEQLAEWGRRVGWHINGTILSPEDGIDELQLDPGLLNSFAFCDALDNTSMPCDTCGWQVDADDIDDNGNCSDCADEETDDE